MAFQERTVALNDGTILIDRSGDGEEIELRATGGVFFDRVDGDPIFVRFNDNRVLIPIYGGRAIDQNFDRLHIIHDALFTGSIKLIAYQKGEGIFDSPALSAGALQLASWERETAWPLNTPSLLGAFNLAGAALSPAYDKWLAGTPANFLTLGAGFVVGQAVLHKEFLSLRLSPSPAFAAGYFIGDNLTIQTPLATLFEKGQAPERQRVWWDQFWLARDAAPADTTDSGIFWVPVSGATDPGVTASSNNARWGIRATTTGFEFVAYNGVGLTIQSAITWPASTLDEFVKVDHVLLGPDDKNKAKLKIFLNDSTIPAIDLNWETGTGLPLWSQSVDANPVHIRRKVQAATLSGPSWYLAGMRMRSGKFNQLSKAV